MAAERLTIDFERQTDGAAVLRASGKLDRATAPLLDGVLRALRAEGASSVVVDLTKIDHIDGRGLDLLLEAQAEALRLGTSVEVTGVPESLRNRRPPEAG